MSTGNQDLSDIRKLSIEDTPKESPKSDKLYVSICCIALVSDKVMFYYFKIRKHGINRNELQTKNQFIEAREFVVIFSKVIINVFLLNFFIMILAYPS